MQATLTKVVPINEAEFEIKLKTSNLPREYQKDLSQYNKLDLELKNYFIFGDFNSGKSVSVAHNLKKFFFTKKEDGTQFRCKYYLFSDVNQILINAGSFNQSLYEEAQAFIRILMKQDLIILDDAFDSKKCRVWSNSKDQIVANWDSFLRKYLAEGKKVWFTSNLKTSQVEENWDESTVALMNKWQTEFILLNKQERC